MKKIVFAVALIFILSIAGVFYFQNLSKVPSKFPYTRKKLEKFKGIWLAPSESSNTIKEDALKMKEWGINILGISPTYCVKREKIELVRMGPPVGLSPEEEYIARIRYAHENGLAVFLELNTMTPWCEIQVEDKDRFISRFLNESLKWARIAEEEQVELFSPLNEPNVILGKENAFEWAQKIIPEIKKVFKGEIVLKLADMNNPGNYSGYDYVAFDVYPGPLEEWSSHVKEVMKEMKRYVKEYNLKGCFFGEVGAPTQPDPYGFQELIAGNMVSEEGQAQVFKIIFNQTWNESKGYFISGWSRNPKEAYYIKPKAEEIIKSWYSS